jgi:hypothetical protein
VLYGTIAHLFSQAHPRALLFPKGPTVHSLEAQEDNALRRSKLALRSMDNESPTSNPLSSERRAQIYRKVFRGYRAHD